MKNLSLFTNLCYTLNKQLILHTLKVKEAALATIHREFIPATEYLHPRILTIFALDCEVPELEDFLRMTNLAYTNKSSSIGYNYTISL